MSKQEETHQLIQMGLLDARVCSAGTYDEALDWIQTHHITGTSNGWQKHDQGSFAPIPCANNPKRTHYMFSC